MTVKRYTSEKDNTIAGAYRENLSSLSTLSNMGGSDILEVFSIFGQAASSSLEQARVLVQIPISNISADRKNNILPASGSVKFKFRMFNVAHGQTTPDNYQIAIHPLMRSWDEGQGLDMESYLDLEASNWNSCSAGNPWHTTGSDFVSNTNVTPVEVPLQYLQSFDTGTEDINVDITGLVEEWIAFNDDTAVNASGSIELVANMQEDDAFSLYSHEGEKITYTFITSSTYTAGNGSFVEIGADAATTAASLEAQITIDFSSKITVNRRDDTLLALTQSVKGFHGNTVFSTEIPVSRLVFVPLINGRGMPNHGLVVKLQDAYEDGSKKKSYYTKKFYSRGTHEFFKKPLIEAQWDASKKDDRNHILKSNSLVPASENLNNIFLYNKRRGSFIDIPNTGSALWVRLHSSGNLDPSSPEVLPVAGGVGADNRTYVTASRQELGVYKATFEYGGNQSFVYDVWGTAVDGVPTTLVTGSGFTIYTIKPDDYHESPSYVINVQNLKDSYLSSEKATFRVYTRNKNWKPNVYTVATQKAPVNTIRDMFYKITKVSDNYEVISYSTGSTPSYSSLSYDNKGSYFDLDMSLLEPNNAYEISFVFKDASTYLEQQEKFRFRVDP